MLHCPDPVAHAPSCMTKSCVRWPVQPLSQRPGTLVNACNTFTRGWPPCPRRSLAPDPLSRLPESPFGPEIAAAWGSRGLFRKVAAVFRVRTTTDRVDNLVLSPSVPAEWASYLQDSANQKRINLPDFVSFKTQMSESTRVRPVDACIYII